MKLRDILEKMENDSSYFPSLSSPEKLSAEKFWLELQEIFKRGPSSCVNKIIENTPLIVNENNEINYLSILLEIIKESGKGKNLGFAVAAMKAITNKNLLDEYCEKILDVWDFLTEDDHIGIAMSFRNCKQILKCIGMLKKIYRKGSSSRIKLAICASISTSGDSLNNKEILIEALKLSEELEQENSDFITKKQIKNLKKSLENTVC